MSGPNVLDVSGGSFTAAWMFGFKVDGDDLEPRHLTWLDASVVLPITLDSIRIGANPHDTTPQSSWQIWVVGSASRTGSFDHNSSLSRRRAEAVRKYLGRKIGSVNVVWQVSVVPLGEVPAMVTGAKDEVENHFHRSILVAMHQVKPNVIVPKPPMVRPPTVTPVIEVEFYFYADRASWFNVSKWQGEFYAVYSVGTDRLYEGWRASASGIGTGLDDIGEGPPIPSKDLVFAGPGKADFPSPESLDGLNGKRITVGARGGKLSLRVKDALPKKNDLTLSLPSTTEWELSQAVGGLGKRQALSKEAQKSLDEAIRFMKGGGGKEKGVPA